MWLVAIAFAAAAAPAADSPYKLVVTWYQSGITAIDYPSRARCERAREALLGWLVARAARAGLPAESAEVAVCIPG